MNSSYLDSQDEPGYNQPLLSVTLTRAWHWGVVMISSAEEWDAPTAYDGPAVVGDHGICLSVAAAVDFPLDTPEPISDTEMRWQEASVTIVLHHKHQPLASGSTSLQDGSLVLRRPGISVGDADGDVVIPATAGTYHVRVSIPEGADPEWITEVTVEFLRTS